MDKIYKFFLPDLQVNIPLDPQLGLDWTAVLVAIDVARPALEYRSTSLEVIGALAIKWNVRHSAHNHHRLDPTSNEVDR